MKKTTNYFLNKPELSDPADITQLNVNADIIDDALKNHDEEFVSQSITNDELYQTINEVNRKIENQALTPFCVNNGSLASDGKPNILGFVNDKSTPIELAFVQPDLNSNGTLGGSSFAVASSDNNHIAYRAFNDSASEWFSSNPPTESAPCSLTIYNPVALKLKSIYLKASSTLSRVWRWFTLYASNDGANWTTIGTHGNGTNLEGVTVTANFNISEAYKYYRLDFTATQGNENDVVAINQIKLNATYMGTHSGGRVTFRGFAIATTAQGETFTAQSIPDLDLSTVLSNKVYIYLGRAGTPAFTAGNLHASPVQPVDIADGDIWFKTLEPLATYHYYGGEWHEINFAPVGEATMDGTGKITAVTTYPYNQNGYSVNAQTVATPATFGVMRVAAAVDEVNCQCEDAALTPENIYKLANFRITSTDYAVGDTVAVPYHADMQLKCITAGTTSTEALNTENVHVGQTLTDGSVEWLVYSMADTTAIYYANVASMKADVTIKAGKVCKTLGYYAANDGGGGTYIIRVATESDTDDGGSLHFLANGLVAELIIENGTVYPEQFGAKGDGIADDSIAIQQAIESGKIVIANGSYTIKNKIVINGEYTQLIFNKITCIGCDGISIAGHCNTVYGQELICDENHSCMLMGFEDAKKAQVSDDVTYTHYTGYSKIHIRHSVGQYCLDIYRQDDGYVNGNTFDTCWYNGKNFAIRIRGSRTTHKNDDIKLLNDNTFNKCSLEASMNGILIEDCSITSLTFNEIRTNELQSLKREYCIKTNNAKLSNVKFYETTYCSFNTKTWHFKNTDFVEIAVGAICDGNGRMLSSRGLVRYNQMLNIAELTFEREYNKYIPIISQSKTILLSDASEDNYYGLDTFVLSNTENVGLQFPSVYNRYGWNKLTFIVPAICEACSISLYGNNGYNIIYSVPQTFEASKYSLNILKDGNVIVDKTALLNGVEDDLNTEVITFPQNINNSYYINSDQSDTKFKKVIIKVELENVIVTSDTASFIVVRNTDGDIKTMAANYFGLVANEAKTTSQYVVIDGGNEGIDISRITTFVFGYANPTQGTMKIRLRGIRM